MSGGNERWERGTVGGSTRRAVLKYGSVLGLGSVLPMTSRRVLAQNDGPTKEENPEAKLSKFANELPNPLEDASVMSPNPSGRAYDVSMVNTTHVFDPNASDPAFASPTAVFAYRDNNDDIGGTFPGKTFEVDSGRSVAVKYTNELTGGHFLPIDTTVHGASSSDESRPRTVTHMHGGKTQPPSDGDPEDTRLPGRPQVMHYSNINPASTLWYHDHSLGITRLNVYAGLAGFYVVRDADEAELNLPSGEYEIPIVLQDRCFDTNGNLFYPYKGEDVDENSIGTPDAPRVPLEFFGNVSVVNGLVWPKATVEARRYRIRLLNGSNSRFYNLRFQSQSGGGQPTVHQIGTDGGFLFDGPNELSGRFLLAPGERMDLIVDFGGLAGNSYLLHNNAGSPFKGGNFNGDDPLPEVMRFDVVPVAEPDTSPDPAGLDLPTSFPGLAGLTEADAVNTRRLTLLEGTETIPSTDPGGPDVTRLQPLLGVLPSDLPANGTVDTETLEGLHWDDPNTEDSQVNEVEVWELYNFTEDTHPIHLHIVQFSVLDRFELVETEEGVFQLDENGVPVRGAEQPVDDSERGPKDTVRANPHEVTRIIVPFDTFPGETVWHCHILEHEDNEMMRPMRVGGRAR